MTIETVHLNTVLTDHTTDQTGRIAAVTGTTSGTGYVCARELARLGARVFLLNRTSSRADAALMRLQQEVPDGDFVAVTCDLQDFASVRTAAAAVRSQTDVLDILCNNAGVMALPDQATGDGYDVQMQTNCLSHFLLTRELFGLLERSSDARIVNHTSAARRGGPLESKYFGPNGGALGGDGTHAENTSFRGPRWERYHQTKLANCAFTYGLVQRLEASGKNQIKALIAHPGLAATSLQTTTAETGGMNSGDGFMSQAQSAEDGALGILRGCADPTAKSGEFFGPEGWTGFPQRLTPEPYLSESHNVGVNWAGCEAAVGKFTI